MPLRENRHTCEKLATILLLSCSIGVQSCSGSSSSGGGDDDADTLDQTGDATILDVQTEVSDADVEETDADIEPADVADSADQVRDRAADDDQSDGSDRDEEADLPAGVLIGAEGGLVAIEGTGFLSEYQFEVPEGLLEDDESVEVTLSLREPTEAESNQFPGTALNLGWFGVSVEPIELAPLVLDAGEETLFVDWEAAEIPEEFAELAASDPEDWVENLSLAIEIDETELNDSWSDSARRACSTTTGTRARYHIDSGHFAIKSVPTRVALGIGGRARPPGVRPGGRIEHGALLELRAPLRWSHTPPRGHTGQIDFEYHALSVTAGGPALPVQTPTQVTALHNCFNQTFDALETVVATAGFDPIAVDYPRAGRPFPIKVFIYDFSTDPTTLASAYMPHRAMYIPTRFMNYAFNGCIAAAAGDRPRAVQKGYIAPELFKINRATNPGPKY